MIEALFFNETFNGNGRTCGTCHPFTGNFTLNAEDIAALPNDDPLFVAEFNPNLSSNFENPTLMRQFGLIVENLDGFGDLANVFTMRGIPHTLGLRLSIDSRDGPRTGWSGDGAPGDGTLRSFAIGAVIQHFPLSTNRQAGVDFRLPTEDELDAMEAFQLSLGRQEELALPLPLKGVVALRGQEIFNDGALGKCSACHFNAGANANPAILGPGAGNLNFNTGVADLPDQPADLTGELVPPDDGLGSPGDGTFNTPTLVEAADTSPFFHDNSVETIEGAVAFYNSDAFNNSPSGQVLVRATGSGIDLEVTQVIAVAAFLRVINALENIRQSLELLDQSTWIEASKDMRRDLLTQAVHETDDAIMVLTGGGLHPAAVTHLRAALKLTQEVLHKHSKRGALIQQAKAEHEQARGKLIETP
ncbi:hypothetical protein [Candidatus Entotheonella palauensis]|uniref:hypothetical protein n=1 Tax=Candidatus Entotheonella palauensis TaxID=93172 RepID=UPI0011779DD3|nr:hypothetical protein [Candidatus Entotheonella palauensis]